MSLQGLVEGTGQIFTGAAYGVTVICGLLSIMVERFVYMRRGYKREAAINAFIGWFYILGGTLLYLVLWMVK
jgi:hypothetical protein